MKKLFLAIPAILLAADASAIYQVYDVQMKLKTTKPATVSLPFSTYGCYFPDLEFRVKVTETIKGYLVCNGPYNLNRPDFVYLKNMSTGEHFSFGSGLCCSWSVYDRLSPVDKAVETGWNFWWTASGGQVYDVYGAGGGKIKAAKYKMVYSRGTRKVTIADGLKGEITGTKYLPRVCGVSMDGMSELGNADSVIHGTWKIKYNSRLSMSLYRCSAVVSGSIACGADGDFAGEDTVEVPASEIQRVLGL